MNQRRPERIARPWPPLPLLLFERIWNQCNARCLQNVSLMPSRIVLDIKEEVRLWVIAGASMKCQFFCHVSKKKRLQKPGIHNQ
jgi:hypothetical protein